MKPNQTRANGKTKAVVTLCVVLAVTLLLGIAGFTGLFGIPRWLPTAGNWPEDTLPLGLDLQGGVYVEYTGEVPEGSDATFEDLVEGTMSIIRDRLTSVGQTEATVQRVGTNGIRVEIPIKRADDTAEQTAAEPQAENPAVPEESGDEAVTEEPAEEAAAETPAEEEAAAESAETETAEAPADEEAAAESTESETAEVEDAEAEKAEADETETEEAEAEEAADTTDTAADQNATIAQVLDLIGTPAQMYFVDSDGLVFMTGDMVKSAAYSYGDKGHEVAFELTSEGKDIFAAKTAASIGQNIIILLDNEVLVNATVQTAITDGRGVITGNYTREEAQAIAAKIQSGALPLVLTQDKVDMVSATLGQDALSTSVTAAFIGILLIMALMIIRYRLNGAVASWALILYVILLFGLIALFRVQLTLPGLAGVVLGIGMAVDANVIIFERFNEEARKGRSAKASLRAGFKNAISAILDANVTTLIAAVVLLIFGTGSIQGFARTLLLGVVVSMISAILITRFLMNCFIDAGCTEIRLFAKVKAEEEVEQ